MLASSSAGYSLSLTAMSPCALAPPAIAWRRFSARTNCARRSFFQASRSRSSRLSPVTVSVSAGRSTSAVAILSRPSRALASSAGGSGETSSIEFAPGTATLTAEARQGLDKIAQALVDRPSLTLTISGESRLESERDAWKRERLKQALRAEKRRQAIAGGAAPNAEVTVSDAEVPALLKEVYRRADIVKPKNALGLAQDLPPAEMEALLLASIGVDEEAMQQLALRRGVVVRDYLATRELPSSRLFLGAPKVATGDAANWTPRVDLKLTLG